jgi:cob(I)alamin adenosyltransferase
MKIYTRSGDDGETGLYGDQRVTKSDEILDVLGGLDELSSWLGICIAQSDPGRTKTVMQQIQHWLFDAGAWAADVDHRLDRPAFGHMVQELEASIDQMTADLPELRAFILPGGGKLGSSLHASRAVCRRVEREVSRAVHNYSQCSELIPLLNRLSDWLFTAARHSNAAEGIAEQEWKQQ